MIIIFSQFVDLAETLAFYRDKDPEMVFQEREASRAVGPELLLGGFGMGGEGCYMGGMPAFKTNAKKGSSSMVFTSKHWLYHAHHHDNWSVGPPCDDVLLWYR